MFIYIHKDTFNFQAFKYTLNIKKHVSFQFTVIARKSMPFPINRHGILPSDRKL